MIIDRHTVVLAVFLRDDPANTEAWFAVVSLAKGESLSPGPIRPPRPQGDLLGCGVVPVKDLAEQLRLNLFIGVAPDLDHQVHRNRILYEQFV